VVLRMLANVQQATIKPIIKAAHRGISQDKLPLYLGFFQKALLGALIAGLVA